MNVRWVAALLGVTLLLIGATATLGQRRPVHLPCAERDFEESSLVVCRYDASSDELRLLVSDAQGENLRTFEALQRALGEDAQRVRFAMNAGMFNDAGSPIGLYVETGAQRSPLRMNDGPGNFHMKPNGVFWQDANGAVHVSTSDAYAALAPTPRLATQSGPMLVIDGALHPDFAQDGESRVLRNGVGVRDERTAYFVISRGDVSFGRFARFFRDELGCTDALFLDGSVSSLWAPSLRRRDASHLLGPMVVVLDRDSSSAP